MSNRDGDFWQGITEKARKGLVTRDYRTGTLAQQLAETGVEARQLVEVNRNEQDIGEAWIPGVEVFSRTIYPQRHRGLFGEFARRDEGLLAEIGLWPKQWAAARMFAQTAKGFHVHPSFVPKGTKAADWFRRVFIEEPKNYSLRRYDDEQWDVMFVVQGVAEMILRDLRDGLPRRTMRFLIDGDNHRSPNNVAVVIPPGVAHAIRTEGSEDVIMAYGTSTPFRAEFEGRIASDVESAPLPESWRRFLAE
jgi:dTDP-4-dehydrorhamnose 3,5-epimerase-like enzyme